MSFLSLIGVCFLFSLLLEVLKMFYGSFYPSRSLQERYGKGTWAVITGASDGIGKGFAYVLAKYGFKICLIARNPEKLEKVKQEITQKYKEAEIKIVVADFKNSLDDGFYDKIYHQLKDLDISILVNNVGIGSPGFFHKDSDELVNEYLSLNVLPQFFLTKKLISKLLKRGKSAVINVSSLLGGRPIPYGVMYSSTKAFDDFFSRCLNTEYRGKIDVMSFRPGSVTSQLTFRRNPGLITLSAEDCVEGCLKSLGKRSFTAGHFKHEWQRIFIDLIPEWALNMVIGIIGPFIVKWQAGEAKRFKEKLSK